MRAKAWMVGVLAAALAAGPAAAQGADSDPLFTGRDLLWAGGFVIGTVALAPLDLEVADAVRDSLFQRNPWVRPTAGAMRVLGWPGSLGVAGAVYLAGRAADRPVLADMGLHAAAAIVLSEAVTGVGKTLAGRARPSRNAEDPYDFGFGRGLRGSEYQSFPSGHATAAFAAASAVTAEIGERWPGRQLAAGGALYAAAALVAGSRLYHNQHWASDVVMGAAIGTFSGWKVVEYVHEHPETRLNRVLLGVSIAEVEGGRVARLWIAPAR